MDYGKLAYLKVEDMERMVSSISKKQKDFSGARAVFEIDRTIDGEYPLAEVRAADNKVCIIIKLTAAAPKETILDVFLGDKLSARHTIAPSETWSVKKEKLQASAKEYLILLHAKLAAKEQLSIRGRGVFVARAEVMVIGGETEGGGRRLCGDAAEGRAVVATCDGGNILVFEGQEEKIDFSVPKTELAGLAADACFCEGKFYLLFLDGYGNLWLRDLDECGYRYVGSGERSAAISACAGGLTVATVKEDRVFSYFLDSFLDGAEGCDAQIETDAQSVCFAKGEDRPVLSIKSRSGSSFVVAEKQTKTADTISVSLTASFE